MSSRQDIEQPPRAATGTDVVAYDKGDDSVTYKATMKQVVQAGNPNIVTDTDGATITFDLQVASKHQVVLGGSRTLAVSNDVDGQTFSIIIQQDSGGNRTVTWWSGILWQGGVTPTLTTTGNKRDLFGFVRLAAGVYLGTAGLNF